MSVYIDASIWPYHRVTTCHMMADTIEELHAMADRIGVARRWFHDYPVFPHYEINNSQRALAIKLDAIQISRERYVEMVKKRSVVDQSDQLS